MYMAPKDTAARHTESPGMTMEDIYNLLMVEIEPDLTTLMIPMLDEIYRDESAKEKKRRTKRYQKAFKKFEKRYAKAMKIWKNRVLAFRDAALGLARKNADEEDQRRLGDIERTLDNT
jgi:hypothetical protein